MNLRVIIFGLLLIIHYNQSSAQLSSIKVLDAENQAPVPFAHVCFESKDKKNMEYAIADENGAISYNLPSTSVIAISAIGYQTLIDTLNPGESKTYRLKTDIYTVDEVVVTGQFKPRKVDKSIYKVNVINSQTINNKAANNLDDLLSNELNIRTSNSGILGNTISMQGLSGEHVKILVDGVPVIGRQNGILDLSQLNIQNVDHIEIVQGPMSVVYGSNALAGAINIITKGNTRKKLQASVKSYYETVGVYDLDGSFSFNFKNQGVTFTAGRYFFGGYSEQDYTRYDEWKPKEQYNADLSYFLNHNSFSLKLASSYFSEELRDLAPLSQPKFGYEFVNDQYHFTNRWDTKAELSTKISDAIDFSSTLAYSTYQKAKNTYVKDLVNLTEELSNVPNLHDTTKINAILFRPIFTGNIFQKINYQTGLDLNYETGTGKRITEDKQIGDYAAFLNLNIALFNDFLEFQPGVRFIHNTEYASPLVHSLNLKYSPIENFSVRASYGKGFRAPSLKELYLTFQDINHNITGNENLKAELSNNYNLWFDFSQELDKSQFDFSANFFYNLIENKIDLLLDSVDITAAQYFNIPGGFYKTKGVSLQATYRFHPRLKIEVGQNRIYRSRLNDLDAFTNSTDYTAGFHYKNLRYLFEIALFYKYNDKYKTYTGYMDQETFDLEDVNERFVDSYHNMDITLSRPFLNHHLNLSLGVKNLFDNKSIFASGGGGVHSGNSGSGSQLINWGRTYFIKVNYIFSRY